MISFLCYWQSYCRKGVYTCWWNKYYLTFHQISHLINHKVLLYWNFKSCKILLLVLSFAPHLSYKAYVLYNNIFEIAFTKYFCFSDLCYPFPKNPRANLSHTYNTLMEVMHKLIHKLSPIIWILTMLILVNQVKCCQMREIW